jgi:hypothetical protein
VDVITGNGLATALAGAGCVMRTVATTACIRRVFPAPGTESTGILPRIARRPLPANCGGGATLDRPFSGVPYRGLLHDVRASLGAADR